mmetsp:Transcript_26567/g.51067  ORF Transcript_26567/g.51067 Transcript_26567/m.51067 type:complete len:93 (-) Transcript_26567:59-337(-)
MLVASLVIPALWSRQEPPAYDSVVGDCACAGRDGWIHVGLYFFRNAAGRFPACGQGGPCHGIQWPTMPMWLCVVPDDQGPWWLDTSWHDRSL